jgi:hypothetical protein
MKGIIVQKLQFGIETSQTFFDLLCISLASGQNFAEAKNMVCLFLIQGTHPHTITV